MALLKNYILFALLFTYSCVSFSQDKVNTSTRNKKALELYIKSNDYMMSKRYDEAIVVLNKALTYDSNYVDALMRLSTIYYKSGKKKLEYEMYERVIKAKPDYPNVYFNYGSLLMRMVEYDKAVNYFMQFLDMPGTSENFKKKATENIEVCKYRSNQMKHPLLIKPVNLGNMVNTDFDEYWPVLTADDNNIYFTRRLVVDTTKKVGYGKYNEDIYLSEKENKKWKTAVPLPGFLNTRDNNEGAISISPDGTFLLFTICSDDPTFGYGWCDIYYSKLKNGQWQAPQNIGPPINTREKETQPSISFDGKTLYYSSNRKGTLGKLDLWKSTLQKDGSWGEPVNLGPEINTEGNEQSPFIHPDDQTLYFSNDTRLGMGESDIFIATKKPDGSFGNVKNLGYPINTDKSEIALFVNARGNVAYYASKVEGGNGGLDIYSFVVPPDIRPNPVCYLKGTVYDVNTKAKLGADFEIYDVASGNLIVESKSDEKTGKFLVAIPANANYMINVSKKGYLFYSEHLAIKDAKSTAYEHDAPLVPIKVGSVIVLQNVFFDSDKYILKKESRTELNKVIETLKLYPNIKIELSGHTDNQGGAAYNKTLSENRAKAVYDYLIKNGIPATRLSYKGYGQEKPIGSNSTEEGRAQNRRTELKVVGM